MKIKRADSWAGAKPTPTLVTQVIQECKAGHVVVLDRSEWGTLGPTSDAARNTLREWGKRLGHPLQTKVLGADTSREVWVRSKPAQQPGHLAEPDDVIA